MQRKRSTGLTAVTAVNILLCFAIATVVGEVTLENNRYSGQVIALDPTANLPTLEEQEQIIDSIKTLMTKASVSVFEATNHRAYFSDVTIVIPEDWSVEADRNASGRWESWKGSNIKVVSEGMHNAAPTTVPGGGCGVPGANMEVPMEYLIEQEVQQRYGDVGIVMAAEWLKYRYGVYEEHGYPGDPLYPHAYHDVITNMTLPTGCTNHDTLLGTWKDRNGNNCEVTTGTGGVDSECRFIVAYTDSDYSIMYISHITKVNHVCNADTHDPVVPTRQNKLCNGKSIWEVIMEHADFANGNNPPDENNTDTTPFFTIVKTTHPALYFLINENCGQKPEGDDECFGRAVYTKLKETVRRILSSSTSIPRVGLRKYMKGASGLFKKTPLIPIEDIDIDEFMDFFPALDTDIYDNITSPEAALVKALKDIETSDYVGEVNVFITQMTWTDEAGSAYPDLLLDEVTVTGMLYGDTHFNPWLRDLIDQTNGNYFFNPDYNPQDATEALLNLVPDLNYVTLLDTTVSVDSEKVIDIYIDSGVGIDTTFTVEFSESDGEATLTDPESNDTTVDFPSTIIPDAAPGQWRMSVKNNNGGTAWVHVTTNPRPDVEQIEIKTWTSASSAGEVDLNLKGLIFYVSVTQGNKAIQDLEVRVIFYAGEAGATSLEVILQDDGLGDPDIQLHDGVYSGYVTEFNSEAGLQTEFFADVSISPVTTPTSSAGFQEITTRSFKANNNHPRILPQDPFAEEPCCGSVAPGAVTVQLSRKVTCATSVVVKNGPGENPYDPPPSQINSAMITSVDQDGPQIEAGTILVTLAWNAPGKDFTTGIVSGYEVWYSESTTDLLENFENGNMVQDDAYVGEKPTPGEYGTEQTATFRMPKKLEEETQYFMVVVGIDALQKGPPSSLLSVTVTAGVTFTTQSTTTQSTTTTESTTTDPTTSTISTTAEPTTTTADTASNSSSVTPGSTASSVIPPQPTDPPNDFVGSAGFWAIIGVSGFVVLLIIVAYIYFCLKNRMKKKGNSSLVLILQTKMKRKVRRRESTTQALTIPSVLSIPRKQKTSSTTATPVKDAKSLESYPADKYEKKDMKGNDDTSAYDSIRAFDSKETEKTSSTTATPVTDAEVPITLEVEAPLSRMDAEKDFPELESNRITPEGDNNETAEDDEDINVDVEMNNF